MRKKKLIAVVAICIICAALISYGIFTQRDAMPTWDLTLSEYPQLFAKEAVIVIGENASLLEKESAEAIATNLENLTGNKSEVISSKKIESFKYTYNLIIVGTPNSNEILRKVYNMTDAIRVTDEYPGENKGILEILRNPWNEEKAMLLVEGSDEWGVKAGSMMLAEEEMIEGLHRKMMVSKLKDFSIEKLVEQKAIEYFATWKSAPWRPPKSYEVKIEKLKVPVLKKHNVYRVYGYLQIPGPVICAIAVGDSGHVYALPKEFNDMVKEEDLRVTKEDIALDLIKVYLLSEENDLIVWGISDCRDKIMILENANDIPYKGKNKDPTTYSEIKPPNITQKNGYYSVQLYTWEKVSGSVTKRDFTISNDGQLVEEKEQIDGGIGEYSVCIII